MSVDAKSVKAADPKDPRSAKDPQPKPDTPAKPKKVVKTDAEWRKMPGRILHHHNNRQNQGNAQISALLIMSQSSLKHGP